MLRIMMVRLSGSKRTDLNNAEFAGFGTIFGGHLMSFADKLKNEKSRHEQEVRAHAEKYLSETVPRDIVSIIDFFKEICTKNARDGKRSAYWLISTDSDYDFYVGNETTYGGKKYQDLAVAKALRGGIENALANEGFKKIAVQLHHDIRYETTPHVNFFGDFKFKKIRGTGRDEYTISIEVSW